MARHSRVYSSMMVSIRKASPSWVRRHHEVKDQTWFGQQGVGGFDSHALPPTLCEAGGKNLSPLFYWGSHRVHGFLSKPKINRLRHTSPGHEISFEDYPLRKFRNLLNFPGQPCHGGAPPRTYSPAAQARRQGQRNSPKRRPMGVE